MRDKCVTFDLLKAFIALYLILFSEVCFSQTTDSTLNGEKTYHRAYSLLYAIKYDVLNSTENIRTGLKMYSDVYHKLLEPHIKNEIVRNITSFTWIFLGKWFSLLWPHEFGHVLRTNQVGGTFSFVRMQFPGIISNLELPNNATFEDKILAVNGGFEANFVISRDIQSDFFRYNGLWNDEYGIAFGNRITYSLYTYLFAFQNPKDRRTWELEEGDPVNFTKLVWEKGGREVFNSDGTVNEDLVNFYNYAGVLSVLWNLVDINFYKQVVAFFGNQLEGQNPFWLGSETFAWSYGTLFNASVLGAELYFYNYLKTGKHIFNVYLKYGFPFRNYGLGITAPDIHIFEKFVLTPQIDLWSQDYYGNGLALTSNFGFNIFDRLDVIGQIGFKTKGYLAGKIIGEGIFGYLGLKYNLYSER
ncbi:MAG: hypothetical protein ACK41G_04885 [Candidatus Thermochlorobacter sp.]